MAATRRGRTSERPRMGILDLFRNQIERRKHPRHSVITTAWIRLTDSTVPYVCVLWDVSEGGARLTAASMSEIPNEFNLLLSRDAVRGTSCRVAWRLPDQIGVRFIDNADLLLHLMKRKSVHVTQ